MKGLEKLREEILRASRQAGVTILRSAVVRLLMGVPGRAFWQLQGIGYSSV